MCRSYCAPLAACWILLGLFGCGSEVARESGSRPLARGPVTVLPASVEQPSLNTEAYDHIVENAFLSARIHPLSTFSVDVDTASYANVRRFLNQQQLPPPGAVRIEELINYFRYAYPKPSEGAPFSVNVELAGCPWTADHRLVRIGLQGRSIAPERRPASNLVFLLDVSGSMRDANKLPLVQSAMKLLVDQLDENDRVSIAVYASASGLVLPSTSADQKRDILTALDQLEAGGSTNGGEGIQLAYNVATENFIPGGVNRVILCTDGDFNVGVTNQSELVRLIEDKARSDVFLSVIGFGMGNLKDSTMEKLANKGNGNYAYIDSLSEARKVLVDQISGTLITIAKDVKIQVDFNPARVASYRLIGYENRILRAEEFQDDTKDAGEIGAGHTVTALYEIVPVGAGPDGRAVEPSKYQRQATLSEAVESDEVLTVRLRYKEPQGAESIALNVPVKNADGRFDEASTDLKFAAAVASFGMLLRDSEHKGTATYESVLAIAEENVGTDRHGYRREFVQLARRAQALTER